MKHLSNCPVCSSLEIGFVFEAVTNRNPSDPARWKILHCQHEDGCREQIWC
mgnify:CR=1 FL=1